MRTLFGLALAVTVALSPFALPTDADARVHLSRAGSFETGMFDESAAEICAYAKDEKKIFFVDGSNGTIGILDVSDITKPTKVGSFDLSPYGKGANSVAYAGGLVAVAVQANDKQANGSLVLLDPSGDFVAEYPAGALPDMVTFSHNGTLVLLANEGEPNGAYTNDPEGSVTIVDISAGPKNGKVKQLSFAGFNGQKDSLRKRGVRISHPDATVAQDLEPEYIAVAKDDSKAFVAMQENNAVAVVDLKAMQITDIIGLGAKNWQRGSIAFDASNKDGAVRFVSWPVESLYMPDAISTVMIGGKHYIVTANEGDGREYDEYVDEKRLGKAKLDPVAFPDHAMLQDERNLGRLKTIVDMSDPDNDGIYERIVAYGGRSFTLFDMSGRVVYDSGDDFERITAAAMPELFNATDNENEFDDRSDDKGPEPEGVATGMVDGRMYAFVGLERVGGIMVYDITNPAKAAFVEYVTNRTVDGDPEKGTAGDLAPEGVHFVAAEDSHTGVPLLIVGNEVSGNVVIYTIISE